MKELSQKRKLVIGLLIIILVLIATGFGLYALLAHSNDGLSAEMRKALKDEGNYEEHIFSFERAYYYDSEGNASDMDTRYMLEGYDYPVYMDCILLLDSGPKDVRLQLFPENANELIRSGFFGKIESGKEFSAAVSKIEIKVVASLELEGTVYLDFSRGFDNICSYADKS